MSEDAPGLSTEESHEAALWLLKTWLLLGHPEAEFEAATPSPDAWDDVPPEIYSWLVRDEPPPPSLSLWAYRLSQEPDAPRSPAPRVYLPTVINGETVSRFRSLDLGIAQLHVAVVYHPGWPIELPQEDSGGPRRIWPWSDQSFELLPRYESQPIRWSRGSELWFRPEAFNHGSLPPLGPGILPEDLAESLLDGAAAPPVGRR